jgi:hypothetical protein
MRILVSGSSLSATIGDYSWPNQLAKKMNAELINVTPDNNNSNLTIFLNFIKQIIIQDFDICLLQLCSTGRPEDVGGSTAFFKIIQLIQNLVNQGNTIRFINGSMEPNLLEQNNLKMNIDLDLWINPNTSLKQLQVDNVSSTNSHPGLESQAVFTELIYNYISKDILNA